MYAVILGKINNTNEKDQKRKELRFKLTYITRYLSAACITTILGFSLWHMVLKEPVTPKNLQAAAHAPALRRSTVWMEVKNTENRIRNIQLPDYSVVSLSPQSSLRYEKDFQKKFRDVFLIGKAYFKVKRNPERPFSVHAGGLKTTALGTSFTINTSESKHRTSVVLHTGKIVVSQTSGTQQPIYIAKAGNGLLYDTQLQTARLTKAAARPKLIPETSLHYEGTALVMKNIPLPKVISLLKESYQVNIITIGKDIDHITYTGTVDSSREQIEQVLKVICLINNLTLSRGAEQEFILQKSNK